MSSGFDPKINKNPKLIDSNILSKNGNALVQRPKENNTGILGFIKKAIHWIFHPSERINRVRDVLNKQLKEFALAKAQNSEIANLYANCSYFNQRVIKKHNDSWISFFLFWNRVTVLDETQLNTLKKNQKDQLDASLRELKSVTVEANFSDSAKHYDRANQLLRSSEALDTSDLSETRLEIQTQCIRMQRDFVSFVTRETERINALPTLQESDLDFIVKAAALKTELGSITGFDKFLTLNSEKSNVENQYAALKKSLLKNESVSDHENRVKTLRDSKFILEDDKKGLDTLLALYNWELQVIELDTRLKQAKSIAEATSLKAEAQKLEKTQPPATLSDKMAALKRKFDLFERMEQTLVTWQGYTLGTPVTRDMQTKYTEAMAAPKDHADMVSNPRIKEIATTVNQIFRKLEECAGGCAQWKMYFNKLKNTNAKLVSESFMDLASEKIQLHTPQDCETFLKTLPQGPAKDEINAAKKAYEDHLTTTQQLVTQAQALFRFYKSLSEPKNQTIENYKQLENYSSDPEIKKLAQHFMDMFKIDVKKLVYAIDAAIESLNRTKPEGMPAVLTGINDLLKRDFTVLELLPYEQKDAAANKVRQLQLAGKYYAPFETEYNKYKQNKEKPEEASVAMDVTKRPIPEFFKHVSKNSSLSHAFFTLRWRYHAEGVSRAVQATDGTNLDALEKAAKAILTDIDATVSFAATSDIRDIISKVEGQLRLLRTLKKTHEEWLELSQRFSYAAHVSAKMDLMQKDISNLQMNDNPLVKAATTLAADVFTKCSKYEQRIAYFRAYFEGMSRQLYQKAKDAPQEMSETFTEKDPFEEFMKELPDCKEKTELQGKRKTIEEILSAVKTYKDAMVPVQALQAKISSKDYYPTKEDREAISRAIGASERLSFFKTNYEEHITSLTTNFRNYHQKLVSALTEKTKPYENPEESLFEKPKAEVEEELNGILLLAEKLKECATEVGQINQVIATVEKMKKMLGLYPAFKDAYTAYSKALETKTNPAPAAFTPGGNVPELVTLLGEQHPISKKYLSLIHTTYFFLKVEPELRRLADAIHGTNGENLEQLDKELKAFKVELDKLNSKFCESKDDITYSYGNRTQTLNSLMEFKKKWTLVLEALNTSCYIAEVAQKAGNALTECQSSFKNFKHPYIDASEKHYTIVTFDMEVIQDLLNAVNNTTKELDNHVQRLDGYLEKYKGNTNLVKLVQRLKDIFVARQEFNAVSNKFSVSADAEIAALESAAESFGVGVTKSEIPAMPMLVVLLGTEHVLIKPFIEQLQRLDAVRGFTQQCIQLQTYTPDAIREMNDVQSKKVVDRIALADHLAPQVKNVVPKLEAKYQALTAELRIILKEPIEKNNASNRERLELLSILKVMSERPDENKKHLSLAFFYQTKAIASPYQRIQSLLKDGSLSPVERTFITTTLQSCFPEIIFKELAFLEKCSRVWKGTEELKFEGQEPITLLEILHNPYLPLPLRLQMGLLRKMHDHQFHPRNNCPITLGPLVDPVVIRNSRPPRYYDRSALHTWMDSKKTDPLTRQQLTLRDLDEKPEVGHLVQEWLLCKNLIKRPVGTLLDMFNKLVKRCPDAIGRLLTTCNKMTFGLAKCKSNHDQISSQVQKWAKDKGQKNYWTDLIATTNALIYHVAQNYGKVDANGLPLHVAKLYQITANLERIRPKLLSKADSELRYCGNHLEDLQKQIQLLHILLNQADAFTEANFKQSIEICAKILMQPSLATLVDQISDGFKDSKDPSDQTGDDTPPVAYQYLFIRVKACNHRHEMRTNQTVEEYHSWIQEIQLMQHHAMQMWQQAQQEIQLMNQMTLQLLVQMVQAYKTLKAEKKQVNYAY